MGAGLVKLAYAYAVDVPLNPNEFRLLAFMALTALDDPKDGRPAKTYFAGREESALALGRRVPDRGASEDGDRERTSAFQLLKVALAGLCDLSAIKQLEPARRGKRAARYELILDVNATRRTPTFVARTVDRRRATVSRTYALEKARLTAHPKSDLPLSQVRLTPEEDRNQEEEREELDHPTAPPHLQMEKAIA